METTKILFETHVFLHQLNYIRLPNKGPDDNPDRNIIQKLWGDMDAGRTLNEQEGTVDEADGTVDDGKEQDDVEMEEEKRNDWLGPVFPFKMITKDSGKVTMPDVRKGVCCHEQTEKISHQFCVHAAAEEILEMEEWKNTYASGVNVIQAQSADKIDKDTPIDSLEGRVFYCIFPQGWEFALLGSKMKSRDIYRLILPNRVKSNYDACSSRLSPEQIRNGSRIIGPNDCQQVRFSS